MLSMLLLINLLLQEVSEIIEHRYNFTWDITKHDSSTEPPRQQERQPQADHALFCPEPVLLLCSAAFASISRTLAGGSPPARPGRLLVGCGSVVKGNTHITEF